MEQYKSEKLGFFNTLASIEILKCKFEKNTKMTSPKKPKVALNLIQGSKMSLPEKPGNKTE